MNTFKEALLKPEILKALEDLNFTKPTPIQSKVLEEVIDAQRDVIALAQTGTGKTAAFSLPILNNINDHDQEVKALILSPTRELALQISNDIYDLAKHMKYVNNLVVYGGSSISQQIRDLKKKPQIVVGTPGRTKDLINRGKLKLEDVKWLVLDEADEMLSMGFKDDLDFILSKIGKQRTILLFSATLPNEIKKITKKYLNDPIELVVGNRNEGAKNVEHRYLMVKKSDKYQALKRLLDLNPNIYSIVFCRTKAETNKIASKLSKDGYNADTLNGDLTQSQRDHVMNKFREKQLQILVATDVAARGLDVNNLTHVINYKLPDEKEAYVHRSGRTGRAGNLGLSYSIIEPNEEGKLRSIQKVLGKKIEKEDVPSGKDVCNSQLYGYIEKLAETPINENEIKSYVPDITNRLKDISKEDLIKKLVSLEFKNFLNYYSESYDINVKSNGKASRKDSKGRRDNPDYTRFFINIGSRDKLNKRNLIDLVNKIMPIKNVDIGDIEILKSFSFIEIEKEHTNTALKAFDHTRYKGRRLSLEPAQEKKTKRRKKSKRRKK